MFIRAKYFGFYPLGSDVEIAGVHIMQCEWKVITKAPLCFGHKKIKNGKKVSAFGKTIFYAKENGKSIYFVAKEWGIGKYHIFLFNNKTNEKLKKNINGCYGNSPNSSFN